MATGYFSQLKSSKARGKRLYDRRKSSKVCPRCGHELNHLKVQCDFCYLKNEIRKLSKTIWRLEKIINENEK